jgi:hypothetical protein
MTKSQKRQHLRTGLKNRETGGSERHARIFAKEKHCSRKALLSQQLSSSFLHPSYLTFMQIFAKGSEILSRSVLS